MLSDEEKKAIANLKTEYEKLIKEDNILFPLYKSDAQRLINLIEKQSKEIEHQKEKRENQKKELARLNAKQIEFNKLVNTVNSYKGQFKRLQKEIEELKEENWIMRTVKKQYISKDKIKAILGIEEDINSEKLLSLLQTIVDENARLEDVEDRKVQIEYNNVFNKGVKSVEDKIKAKIEELNKDFKEYENGQEWEIQDEIRGQIDILQSLLEKE